VANQYTRQEKEPRASIGKKVPKIAEFHHYFPKASSRGVSARKGKRKNFGKCGRMEKIKQGVGGHKAQSLKVPLLNVRSTKKKRNEKQKKKSSTIKQEDKIREIQKKNRKRMMIQRCQRGKKEGARPGRSKEKVSTKSKETVAFNHFPC